MIPNAHASRLATTTTKPAWTALQSYESDRARVWDASAVTPACDPRARAFAVCQVPQLQSAERMRLFLAFVLLWVVLPASAQVTQQTTGWCSPAVAGTGGNVTVVCQGVDPKALARLQELLDKKDLELADKIKEADEWVTKYRELEARLCRRQQQGVDRGGRANQAGEVRGGRPHPRPAHREAGGTGRRAGA